MDLTRPFTISGIVRLLPLLALLTACSDGNDSFTPAPTFSLDPATIDVSDAADCDILQPDKCAFPFPSDFYTVADDTAMTGRRVNLNPAAIPANSEGVAFDPGEYNRNDGFSQGPLILLEIPDLDLAATGAAPVTDTQQSLEAGAPVQLIDAATGERQLIWAEWDVRPIEEERRALMIRTARNLTAGQRYIVVLQDLVDSNGNTIPSSDAFTVFKEGIPSDIPAFEDRRAHFEDIFSTLEGFGIARESLYLAWDFTVASTENITGRMLEIRDDSLTGLAGTSPALTITSITNFTPDEDADQARRVEGTIEVPNFMDTADAAPGSRFNYDSGDPDALPVQYLDDGTVQVPFLCTIPHIAFADPDNTVAVVVGHGLYGNRETVTSFAPMAQEQNLLLCGVDSWGMSSADIGVAFDALSNINEFPKIADRIQQGWLNITLLSEAMKLPEGFANDPAFQDDSGAPLFQTGAVHYDGISQGAVLGAALSAVNPNFERSVLNVAGMRFSLLSRRSDAWPAFSLAFDPAYPDPLDKPLVWSVIQMLWDRGENNGYVNHVTNNPLPGSTPTRVLIHIAVGDKTVNETAGEILARSLGVPRHNPTVVQGRHIAVEPYEQIETIPAYPYDGNGLVIWDSGPFPIADHDGTPLQSGVNEANTEGYNTHGMPFDQRAARDQKAYFWRTGQIENVCGGEPCYGDGYDGTPGDYSPPDS
jgi:hypothetical protein